MAKTRDVLLAGVMVAFSLIPPWTINLTCELNSLVWLWASLLSGFGVFYIMAYARINVWAKLFLVWAYLLCFLSKAPYISFTMFWSVIAGAVYYILVTKVEDRKIFYKSAQAIFFLIITLLITQFFGRDTLLNFNLKTPVILGTIGNRMIFGSFVVCLAPFILKNSRLNFIPLWIMALVSQSAGPVLSVASGTAVYAFMKLKHLRMWIIGFSVLSALGVVVMQNEFATITSFGRGPVWVRTMELVMKNPIGYGGSTYKLLFPVYSQDIAPSRANGEWEYDNTRGKGLAWRRAHNAPLQIAFEYGIPGLVLFMGFFLTLYWRSRKDPALFAGLTMVMVNTLTAFPERSSAMALLLLTILAFLDKKESLWH